MENTLVLEAWPAGQASNKKTPSSLRREEGQGDGYPIMIAIKIN
jgi:hypothetical protein